MVRQSIRTTADEFDARVVAARPRSDDDVSITTDGRRLDSKAAVLAWWADVAPEIEAENAALGRAGDHGV